LCAMSQWSHSGGYGRRMLHHVVTFHLGSDAPAGQAERICDAIDALAARLPEVRSAATGVDLGLREGNASCAAVLTFDDVDSFGVYADHPEHQRIIRELIAPHIDSRHPVQFTT
jgi:Stress responsive A/B Barrel Domain